MSEKQLLAYRIEYDRAKMEVLELKLDVKAEARKQQQIAEAEISKKEKKC